MGITAAIHQPEHIPWLGFFDILRQVDVFVLLDDVQFAKNNRQNRNQIVSPEGVAEWITVPVKGAGRLHGTIGSVKIDSGQPWATRYLSTIHRDYQRYPYFEEFFRAISDVVSPSPSSLLDLNLSLLTVMSSALEITTPVLRSSEMQVEGAKSQRLVSILREIEATSYLAGSGSRDYMDLTIFQQFGIEVTFRDYIPRPYDAPNGFVPGVSALDALFSLGPGARDVM